MIVDGEKYWSREPGQHFSTNVGPDGRATTGRPSFTGDRLLGLLFDPAPILPILLIDDAEDKTHAGRSAISITASPRMDVDLVHLDWHFATRHVLTVDAEYGVLLRYQALLDDNPFILWEVEEIGFNEALPAGLFAGPADAQVVEPVTFPDLTKKLGRLVMRELRRAGLGIPPEGSEPPN
jgi:hypothetical protein